MSGSAKESSSVSESSGSSGAANGSSSLESDSSSGSGGIYYDGSSSSGSSSGSGSSSSSCHCGFEVSEITLTSGTSGFYKVTNTGCGELLVIGHGGNNPVMREVPFPLSEGETLTVVIEGEVDIRLTSFEVITDCQTKIYDWPDWP